MSSNHPERMYSSPAWLYRLEAREKLELVRVLTFFKYTPMTQSLDFGEENRWLPRTLINHIQDIEREILPSLDKGLAYHLLTEGNIDIVIWLAILSLGKWFRYDTQVRSRLHVMEESDGEVIRQAYGIALVEYFPAINNSQSISSPQDPSTETGFYRWGYVDQLRGAYEFPESSERESLRANRLEPLCYLLPTVTTPMTALATRNTIRSFWNVLFFCVELVDGCRVEYAALRYMLLLEELNRDAAEILEIGSNYMHTKSWENHVICEYVKLFLTVAFIYVCALVGSVTNAGE